MGGRGLSASMPRIKAMAATMIPGRPKRTENGGRS